MRAAVSASMELLSRSATRPGEGQLPHRDGPGAAECSMVRGRQMRILNLPWRWAMVAVLAVLAAGCGSSSAPLTRSPTTTPPVTATTPASSATAASGHGQHVTVTPATGLRSGQQVQVQASGFSPGESLVVIECASKGAATASGDCNLTGMQGVTTDASGRVSMQLTVTKGPFGANKIVCGPPRPA
jgi:Neocarzinostatin family